MLNILVTCHVVPILCSESAIPSVHAGVTYVMGRYDNGGPNTGPTEMQTNHLLDIVVQ